MCHTRAARINHLALYLIEVDVWINRSDDRPSISTEKQKVSCIRYTIYIVADLDIILLDNMQWHVIMLKFLYHNVSITVVIRIPVTSGMMKCNVTAVMFCVTRHMSRGVTYQTQYGTRPRPLPIVHT